MTLQAHLIEPLEPVRAPDQPAAKSINEGVGGTGPLRNRASVDRLAACNRGNCRGLQRATGRRRRRMHTPAAAPRIPDSAASRSLPGSHLSGDTRTDPGATRPGSPRHLGCGALWIAVLIATAEPLWPPGALLSGYTFAWIGHFRSEHNKRLYVSASVLQPGQRFRTGWWGTERGET